MPPGQVHSVLTVQPLTEGLIPSNPYPPRPTVMSGYHFYNTSTLEMTLEASILHALWHDIWTNTQLDILDAWKARMLASITIICDNHLAATKPPSGHRTQTKGSPLSYDNIRSLPLDLPNLFALLYMCRYWKVLRSLPLQGATEEDNEDEDALADDFRHLVTHEDIKVAREFQTTQEAQLADVHEWMARGAAHLLAVFFEVPGVQAKWVAFKRKWDARVKAEGRLRAERNTEHRAAEAEPTLPPESEDELDTEDAGGEPDEED